MNKKSIGFAQSSYDIKYYEKLIKEGENIEIISIHPYATYYIEKECLPYKVIEDYFSEEERNTIYIESLAQSNILLDEIDKKILNITNDTSLKISNSEYIDADLINPVLIKFKILKELKRKINFVNIYISKNQNKRKKRDKMLFYSYMSWFDVSQVFVQKIAISFNSFKSKLDNFDYPYSFFEKNRELLKKFIPNKIIMKKILRNKAAFKESKIKSNKEIILFLEKVGPTSDLFNELITNGYQVLLYNAQKSIYDPSKIYIYNSDINDYEVLNYDFKELEKSFLLFTNKFVKELLIDDIFESNVVGYKISNILRKKIENMIFTEIWHSYLVTQQFKVIQDRFRISLTVSLETYKTFIKPIVNLKYIKHLVLFHGPKYTLHNAKNSVSESLQNIKYAFLDGLGQKTLYNKSFQDIKQVFITGNSIYSTELDINTKLEYDILYMTTKLDPNEITFHTDFSNNIYVRDSYKIVNHLKSSSLRCVFKFKPISANIGLSELPFFNEIKNYDIDIHANTFNAQELMNKSKVVLLDSLGTSLMQALSLDKIVILYNPHKYSIEDEVLSKLQKSLYYCTTLNQLFIYLKDLKKLTQKDTSIFLKYFANTDKKSEILINYNSAIKEILNAE